LTDTSDLAPASPDSVEKRAIASVAWRLLPLIVISYCVAYIDRANIAFASLTMNKDLNFSPYLYGWGAGIFFFGYFLFEIPSNIMLERVGARLWIARIMLTWAFFSAATAFVTGPASFITIRFLLGAAEAGFFPGMILYLTYWFPARYRGRVISTLFLAQPIANGLASSASGMILELDGLLHLRGWQWIFILEALPAVILAGLVLKIMTDRPAAASWLRPDEKAWLIAELEGERDALAKPDHARAWKTVLDPRVLVLSLIYFFGVTANYGITFFLPQIIKGTGLSNMMTGFVGAIPYIFGMLSLLVFGWSSDRSNERRWHLIAGSVIGCAGLVWAGWSGSSFYALAGLSLAVIGMYGSRVAFWPLPSQFLTGVAAASGIAMINATGNLGGYVGPFVIGWIKDSTGSFENGLYFLAACSLGAGIVTYLAIRPESSVKAQAVGATL